MVYTQAISLDVARESVLHINAKQYDSGSRNLLVTILESGAEATVPAGSTVTLNARRPDGSAQSFVGSVSSGKVLVGIDSWILEQYGTAYCSISIVDSGTAKITTLSFRLIVERSEGSGWILVYVAGASLAAGSYYITLAGVNYQFTTTSAVPAGGKIYFSSTGTTGKTTDAGGSDIETLTLSVGTTGTQLTGSDVINFLTQMMTQLATNNAAVAAVQADLANKADQDGAYDDLTSGTAEAVIDPNSYTANTSPYLYRQSPSGKRCEMDIIGGTVGWNQYCNEYPTTTVQGITLTNDGNGKLTASGKSLAGNNHFFIQSANNRLIYKNHKYFVTIGDLSANKGAAVNFRNITTSTHYANVSILSSHSQYAICNAADDGVMGYYLNYPYADTTITGTIYPMVIDLTALLGSTIADYAYTLESNTSGSGIAWLRSFGFLTKSYYPYSEPTLESVQATARAAVGINQWDEEWADNITIGSYGANFGSLNYIRVIPNATYYFETGDYSISGGGLRLAYYDADKVLIGNNVSYSRTVTIPSDCSYIKFGLQRSRYGTTYLNDICINISNSSINGTYYPYESHTYTLDSSLTLRGIPKLDSNNNIYYDGDKCKADGTVTRRFGVVDLGTLDWAYVSQRFRAPLNDASIPSTSDIPNARIVEYQLYPASANLGSLDKGMAFVSGGGYNLLVRNTSYTSAATFKTAMSGVYLVYELATPTTETADSFTPIQYTGSTEAFTTSNDVPVGIDGKYYTDLTLPKLPTANGTYSLKCTVTDGVGIVSWVSE